jgi:hypothetical protein
VSDVGDHVVDPWPSRVAEFGAGGLADAEGHDAVQSRPGQGFSPRAATTDASSMPVGVFPPPTRSLQNFTMIITTETQRLRALGVNMKGRFALRRKYSVG